MYKLKGSNESVLPNFSVTPLEGETKTDEVKLYLASALDCAIIWVVANNN